jgi:PIN domain nuclease of toxin-antitoxin system
MEKGHNISISQITLFELSAKGAKYVNNGTLLPETVTEGIRAILYDDEIEIVPFHDSKLLLTSFKLRNTLTDFIDCLIVATAINHCDALITEDEEIHKLTKKNGINELIEATNPKFKIKRVSELL